jgi:hypothetical protein
MSSNTTDGLVDLEVSSVEVQYGIGVGENANQGTDGQVLVSGGIDKPMRWEAVSGVGNERLTASTNITISPDGYYDGTTASTITASSPAYTGGDGIDVSVSDVISADVDGTTITNTGGDGTELAVLKVPQSLTAGTGITYSSGTTYDGSTAITISSSGKTYEGTDPISVDNTGDTIGLNIDSNTLEITATNLAVKKVPQSLTAGTGIGFSTGTTYDGSTAITISATDDTEDSLTCYTRFAPASSEVVFPDDYDGLTRVSEYNFLPVANSGNPSIYRRPDFHLNIPASVQSSGLYANFYFEVSLYLEVAQLGFSSDQSNKRDAYYRFRYSLNDSEDTSSYGVIGLASYSLLSGGLTSTITKAGEIINIKDILSLPVGLNPTDTIQIWMEVSNTPQTNNSRATPQFRAGKYSTIVNVFRPCWTMKSSPIQGSNLRNITT